MKPTASEPYFLGDAWIQKEADIFPFQTRISLEYTIDFWRSRSADLDLHGQQVFRDIEQTIQEFPYLGAPIEDIKKLQAHQTFLKKLLSPLIPPQDWNNGFQLAAAPFSHRKIVLATKRYQELLDPEKHVLDFGNHIQINSRIIYAYKAILKTFYEMDMQVDLPIVLKNYLVKEERHRYLKLVGFTRFSRAKSVKPLPKFTENDLRKLLDKPFNFADWAEVLPPDHFLFEGVTISSFTDITVEQCKHTIQDLLQHGEIKDKQRWLQELESELQALFRLSDLRLGMATLQGDGRLNFHSNNPIWNSLLIKSVAGNGQALFAGSFYEALLRDKRPVIIEDLEKQTGNLVKAITKAGYRNLILVPLMTDDRLVGILELAHPKPGTIDGLSLFKINQIKPIFANALKGHQEDFENKVEAELLTKFTAIHPAISWRFREAAIASLDRREVAPIVFKNLYPIYGSLDIRDSSKKRSQAASLDLQHNLESAQQIFRQAHAMTSMSVLDELEFKVAQKLAGLNTGFSTDDEVSIAEFIRMDINPVLEYLQANFSQLGSLITKHQSKTDPESRIFSQHRTAYEDALTQLNQCMVKHLEEEEKKLQEITPCFFEKYQTDGVEYNIYLGESLMPHRRFEEMFIDEVRLRQLVWTAEIMNKASALCSAAVTSGNGRKKNRPANIALEIAPLILAYGSLISLKFYEDDKKLDVEGSYNVRYEIIKKRIDKATILGSKERLTQPGHLAIVYSRERDAEIYRRHFDYLHHKGQFEAQWEEFDLAPMAGAEGLKALRIKPLTLAVE